MTNLWWIVQVLRLDAQMQQLAEELKHENSLLVFGRGYNYATALEAALKVRCACTYKSMIAEVMLAKLGARGTVTLRSRVTEHST